MLRRVAELQTPYQRSGRGRIEGFVKRARRVRVQVVADQDQFLRLRIAPPQQVGDLVRPVDLRPPRPGRHLPPTGQRFTKQKQTRQPARIRNRFASDGAASPKSVITFLSATATVAHPSPRRENGYRRVFHTGPAPLPFPPRTPHRPAAGSPNIQSCGWSCRFFSVRRTVCVLIAGTIRSSTMRSASSCSVQFA